jgi:transcriptional regulator with XRE-family HTH domain
MSDVPYSTATTPLLSISVGALVHATRQRLGLRRADLAARVGVSTRLLAEFERGERPNVSLETALQVLDALGITMRLGSSSGETLVLPVDVDATAAREARAAARRATWTARVVRIEDSDDEPTVAETPQERLGDVTALSRNVHVVATATRVRAKAR